MPRKSSKKQAKAVDPPAPSAVSHDSPQMGFAALHACFSDSVRSFLDAMIESAQRDTGRAHLVVHMRKGLQQMEAFMRQQYVDGGGNALGDFEAVVARESDLWRDHVATARADKEYGVQERILQDSLQVAVKAMDLKVGRPGRPDDAVYENSEYARKYMPRGNFIAEWRSPTSDVPFYFPIVRAYRKFTGQEDDGEEKRVALGDELLSKFFTKPKELARHVISTTKENGEAGHLSVLKRDDGTYLFALGSKNTHLVALSLNDIENACAAGRTSGNDPYKAAGAIARALMKMIASLSEPHHSWLCEFLWQTRATASFEILCPDHQHVQLLDYIDGDTPVFYGLSLPSYTHMDGVEICVNPVLLYEAMRALGIRTVEYKVVEFTPTLYAQTLHDIKNSYQHEGAVNLFLDDTACVIGMEKFKTAWYVSLRAIREKAKTFSNKLFPKRAPKAENAVTPEQALQNSRVQMRKRFNAIQVYLQLSSEVADAYCALGDQFVEFVYEHKLRGKSAAEVQEAKHDVADLFPVVWKQFLETTELSDVVTLA